MKAEQKDGFLSFSIGAFIYSMRLALALSCFAILLGERNTVISTSSIFSVCGWLPWWDFERAVGEFIGNTDTLDIASPFVFTLESSGDIHLKALAFEQKLSDLKSVSRLVIPSINNEFDGIRVSNIINSEQKSNKHIGELVQLVEKYALDGIELDYEFLLEEDMAAYNRFAELLSEELHKRTKLLIITLHPKTEGEGIWHGTRAQDWKTLSRFADYLRIMAYDYRWETSPSGPIAPLNWFEDVISYALETIPLEKIILGLGLYGYNWANDGSPAQALTLQETHDLAIEQNADILFDKKNYSSYFVYENEGKSHSVWLESVESVDEKLSVVIHNNITGICIWRLGGVPDNYYRIIKERFSQ